MPTAREFTISLEDRPGTLGKLYQALAEERVNILAYQQFPHEKGNGSVRLVVDNPDKAESVLDRQRSNYKRDQSCAGQTCPSSRGAGACRLFRTAAF